MSSNTETKNMMNEIAQLKTQLALSQQKKNKYKASASKNRILLKEQEQQVTLLSEECKDNHNFIMQLNDIIWQLRNQ